MTDEELFKAWKSEQYKDQSTEEKMEFVEHLHTFPKYFEEAFLAGLKAGRPQWHKVADGDLPEVDNRIVLCVCVNGYIDGKRNYTLKLLTRKEFPLFQPVYAWKEIVLPELPKEIV